MYNISGNPDNYPTSVRAAAGSDPRNATTNAATASDLADRTEWLKKRTIDRFVTLVSNMTGLTDVNNGDFVLVKNLGWFYYSSITRTPVDGFVYAATGKGTGSWIRNDLSPIFGNSDKDQGIAPKIKPALLPPQLQLAGLLTMSNRITSAVTSTTLVTLQESMTSLSGMVAGDQIVGSIGPILLYNDASSGDAQVLVSAQDDANGSVPAAVALASITVPAANNLHGNLGPMTIPFTHTVAASGVTRIYLRARASSIGGALWLTTFESLNNTLGNVTVFRG